MEQCLSLGFMYFLDLLISSRRKKKYENHLCMFPVFRLKQILMFSFVTVLVSHILVSPINLTESSTEMSNEELKQQLQEALEVSNIARYAVLEICISF